MRTNAERRALMIDMLPEADGWRWTVGCPLERSWVHPWGIIRCRVSGGASVREAGADGQTRWTQDEIADDRRRLLARGQALDWMGAERDAAFVAIDEPGNEEDPQCDDD